ncbi:MAG: pirin family protein [Cytophagales bacterium]|nr:pirin family protein [Bernardetiaceae bacterium]MDW8210193.1 pirin family protein [Cytophagales bacterium]
MRPIKKLHQASYHLIADLVTYSPLPNPELPHLDPFLLLNHHGYQIYPPNNRGLPFGPHPHRGMETVTFIIAGEIMHQDSQGYQSIIKAGGVQWMTAGKGLLHAEVSPETFRQQGGELEILQLWLNLPARLKMTSPRYAGLQKEEIPLVHLNEKTCMQLIAGNYNGKKGAFEPLTDVFLGTIQMQPQADWETEVLPSRNVFFYVVRGKVKVNGHAVPQRHLAEFESKGSHLQMSTAQESALFIFGHATPFNEPIVSQGPFVMNSIEEIKQAYADYRAGKFGSWKPA